MRESHGPTRLTALDNPISLSLVAGRSVWRVKGWQADSVPASPRGRLAGYELPVRVGETRPEDPRVLCVGPGDWLCVASSRSVWALQGLLEALRHTSAFAVVDLSAGLSVFELHGTSVREVLGKSCGLDVEPGRFTVGHCARTRFAQIPVVIDCIQDPGVFELYVSLSYTAYLSAWLTDAAIEFAVS